MGELHYIKRKFSMLLPQRPGVDAKARMLTFEPGYYHDVDEEIAEHWYFRANEDAEKAARGDPNKPRKHRPPALDADLEKKPEPPPPPVKEPVPIRKQPAQILAERNAAKKHDRT